MCSMRSITSCRPRIPLLPHAAGRLTSIIDCGEFTTPCKLALSVAISAERTSLCNDHIFGVPLFIANLVSDLTHQPQTYKETHKATSKKTRRSAHSVVYICAKRVYPQIAVEHKQLIRLLHQNFHLISILDKPELICAFWSLTLSKTPRPSLDEHC